MEGGRERGREGGREGGREEREGRNLIPGQLYEMEMEVKMEMEMGQFSLGFSHESVSGGTADTSRPQTTP